MNTRTSILLGLLLTITAAATRAAAQTIPDGTVAGAGLAVGPGLTQADLNSTAAALIKGVGARTPGQDLAGFNSNHELVRGLLGTADIPSVFTRRDLAESIAGVWNFTNGLTVGGNLTGASGTLQIASPTRISGTTAQLLLHESDAGADLKYWQFFSDAGKVSVRALTDVLGSPTELWSGYRSANTANVFELGATVERLGFARNMFTDIGSYTGKAKNVFVSELIADVFTVIDKQVIGNGSFRVGRGTTLTRDLTTIATTIFVKKKVFRYLDFVLMQGLGASGQPQFEVLRITGIYADCTGAVTPLPGQCGGIDNDDYAITVERSKDTTSGANSWIVGDGASGTDVYLDVFAWSSGMIAYGSAVLGDRSLFHVDFDGGSPTPIRSQASGSVTIASGASTGGGGGLPSAGQSWWRSTAGSLFTVNVPAINGSTNQGSVLRCSMSVEIVYFVTSATTPGAGSQWPLVKGPVSLLNPLTFAVQHQGNGVNTIRLIGTREGDGAYAILSPEIPTTAGWHHYVFTWSSVNGGRAYDNGVLTGTPTGAIGGTTGCVEASTNDVWSSVFAGGHLSEADVYAYELGPEQVKAHYESAQTNRSGYSAGPSVVGYERTSDTDWWGISERWACGNLADLYGFTQKTYGCAWGDEASTWVSATAADGFSIWSGGARVFGADLTGSMSLAKDLTVGTNGSIRSGATAYDTGTGYWLDYNGGTPRMRIGTISSGSSFLRWTGSALEVKSNTVSINSSGLSIASAAGGSFTALNGLTWTSSVLALSQLGLTGGATAGGSGLYLYNVNAAAQPATIDIAIGNGGPNEGIFMSTSGWFTRINSTHSVNGTATAHGTYSCLSIGQAVRSINVERGYVMGVTCGTP